MHSSFKWRVVDSNRGDVLDARMRVTPRLCFVGHDSSGMSLAGNIMALCHKFSHRGSEVPSQDDVPQ